MPYLTIITIAAVLLVPADALAWGPATHLEIGQAVLANQHAIAPAVRALLAAFPQDFLYGNISADIVVAKNLVAEIKHCHNWKVGFRLLKKARAEPQQAFAYGYLCHLAADTVAHNNYIPEMMIRSFSTTIHRHIYWELRFDALADRSTWKLPKEIARGADPGDDLLLESIIEDTPLSFRTNKRIFSSMMSIQRVERWHTLLKHLSKKSKWVLAPEFKDRYFSAALDSTLALLSSQKKAPCVKKDPTGRHNLNSSKLIRKKLKGIKRRGRDWETAMNNALTLVSLDR
jgi:hypothetical protein